MEKDKIKNLKDLEYNHLLNKQNILLVLIGTSIISVVFTEKTPQTFSKVSVILTLVTGGILSLLYFNKKLVKIEEEIKDL